MTLYCKECRRRVVQDADQLCHVCSVQRRLQRSGFNLDTFRELDQTHDASVVVAKALGWEADAARAFLNLVAEAPFAVDELAKEVEAHRVGADASLLKLKTHVDAMSLAVAQLGGVDIERRVGRANLLTVVSIAIALVSLMMAMVTMLRRGQPQITTDTEGLHLRFHRPSVWRPPIIPDRL